MKNYNPVLEIVKFIIYTDFFGTFYLAVATQTIPAIEPHTDYTLN